jgi:hypothetical protein
VRKLFVVIPALALAAACASASAKSRPADMPALNVPPPPPRIIESAPEPLPEPVNELPANPPATNTSRTSRPPASKPASSESRVPDPKPVEPPPPTTTDPAPVVPAAPPSAQLRTPQTADTSNAEKGVRGTIDRARQMLNTVDYRPLNRERKKAYDDAQRYMKQAEEALGKSNFVFAQAVANKAETLAKELSGKTP